MVIPGVAISPPNSDIDYQAILPRSLPSYIPPSSSTPPSPSVPPPPPGYGGESMSTRSFSLWKTLLLPPLLALFLYLLAVYALRPLYTRLRARAPHNYSLLEPLTHRIPSLFSRRNSMASGESLLGDEELEEGLQEDVSRRGSREERRLSVELERGFRDESDEEEEDSRRVYHALCPGKPPPKPRLATLRALYDPVCVPKETETLDSAALVLFFPAPRTVTGEDIVEFHIHGGNAVVKTVLGAISKVALSAKLDPRDIRYAEPGEFTRRAFYNNRLDMTQIEALGDTLSAETEQQRRLAVRGTTSTLGDQYEVWREQLLQARGVLEALIDFSEDQHFDESPATIMRPVTEEVRLLRTQLQASIQNASRGELLRSGISIALVGAPNAGKSSLLNRIVGREAAIVSSEEGTTRDVVDVGVDIGGFFCRFGDLAGLRTGSKTLGTPRIGEIEREGMRRAKERAFRADVIIIVVSVEPSHADNRNNSYDISINSEVEETLRQCNPDTQNFICVVNKADLLEYGRENQGVCSEVARHPAFETFNQTSRLPVYAISCKEAQDHQASGPDPGRIQSLLRGLTENFKSMTAAVLPDNQTAYGDSSRWAESLGASERQRILLQQCLEHLETFLLDMRSCHDSQKPGLDEEEDVDVVLAAESLRAAADCLAKITGRGEAGDVEEILGVVFEKFCVGK